MCTLLGWLFWNMHHFVHGDDEETHQDALACFANVGLVVAAPCGDGDMTRVVGGQR